MTIVFRDGFDTYNGIVAGIGTQSKWTNVAISGTFVNASSLVPGRFGGQALRLNQADNTSTAGVRLRALDTPISSGTIKGAIRWSNNTNPGGESLAALVLGQAGGLTGHVALGITSGGAIRISRIGSLTFNPTFTTLGQTLDNTIPFNIWVGFALEFSISDTVGTLRLLLNGEEKLNLTNQDTRNGVSTTVDNVSLWTGQIASLRHLIDFDDLIVYDTFVGAGERRIETLYPNGDGTILTLTPSTGVSHFGVVDELQANNTDWLSGTTIGNLDLLGLTDLSSTPSAIDEVNVVMYSQKTDATSRALAAGIKSGATIQDGANINQAVGFTQYNRPVPLDPNTGLAWTPAAVNALELQPKVVL